MRHCPERIRPEVEFIFVIVGYWAIHVLMGAALFFIILVPLLLACIKHPDRPIFTAPIHFLREHFSHDVAFNIYLGICFLIWAVLFYAWMVFDYVCKEASKRKDDNVA